MRLKVFGGPRLPRACSMLSQQCGNCVRGLPSCIFMVFLLACQGVLLLLSRGAVTRREFATRVSICMAANLYGGDPRANPLSVLSNFILETMLFYFYRGRAESVISKPFLYQQQGFRL